MSLTSGKQKTTKRQLKCKMAKLMLSTLSQLDNSKISRQKLGVTVVFCSYFYHSDILLTSNNQTETNNHDHYPELQLNMQPNEADIHAVQELFASLKCNEIRFTKVTSCTGTKLTLCLKNHLFHVLNVTKIEKTTSLESVSC